MAKLVPQPHHSLERWLRHLDRASQSINPFLTVLAIGLAVLNMAAIMLLAPHLPIIRDTLGQGLAAACSASPARDPSAGPPPPASLKAWGF